jgi:transcriptional regulator with XRE-family HTH domain
MSLRKTVSRNIKALRLQRGLSQQKLAEQAHMTLRYVSYLENTEANVTLDVLERVATGLGVSVTQIVNDNSSDAAIQPPPKKAAHGLEYAVQLLTASLSMIEPPNNSR